ncbi:hypothetical protein AXF42_Ash006725 [Apostasia shenzhenica]|uniref:Uncharacterized protein n=1 Tax=Apostasia shenzhenica TaxID=1088818 RepID=A0A2I0AIZ0_9ASPA|nr:hypothetical protein AXF42_Ash006725 [Apostasia shenzhenica]
MQYYLNPSVCAASSHRCSLSSTLFLPDALRVHTTFMASIISTPRLRVLLAFFLLWATRGEAMDGEAMDVDSTGDWSPLVNPSLMLEAGNLAGSLMNAYGPPELTLTHARAVAVYCLRLGNGLLGYHALIGGQFRRRVATGYRMGIIFAEVYFILRDGQVLDLVRPADIPWRVEARQNRGVYNAPNKSQPDQLRSSIIVNFRSLLITGICDL